jgi:hypothetical protein
MCSCGADMDAVDEAEQELRALRESNKQQAAEIARLTAERDGPLYRCPQCDHLRIELGEARAVIAALLARCDAAERESRRMDYVRKAYLLDDEDALFDLCVAETSAEFNAAIDSVLANRTPL